MKSKFTILEVILFFTSICTLILYLFSAIPKDNRVNNIIFEYNSLVDDINSNCVCSRMVTEKGTKQATEKLYFYNKINGSGLNESWERYK